MTTLGDYLDSIRASLGIIERLGELDAPPPQCVRNLDTSACEVANAFMYCTIEVLNAKERTHDNPASRY